MPEPLDEPPRSIARQPFTPRAIAVLPAVFAAGLAIANVTVQLATRWLRQHGVEPDVPKAWPFSIFVARIPSPADLIVAAGALILFALAAWRLYQSRYRLTVLVPLALLLVLAGNLVQGWHNGLIAPTASTAVEWRSHLRDPLDRLQSMPPSLLAELSEPIQYYHEAVRIEHPLTFVRQFNALQPDLLAHSRTHPPGAVLVYWLPSRLLGPAGITVAIAIVSTALSLPLLAGVLRRLVPEGPPDATHAYVVWLFALLPAVQIYYCASLDALVATAMLGALYFFLREGSALSTIGLAVCLFVASFLTFGAVFIAPVLAGHAWLSRRRGWKVVIALAGVAVAYGLLAAFGFDYLAALRTASQIEHPEGFYLLADPASYVLTRLEGLFEILAFLGPFLLVLLVRGLREGAPAGLEARRLFWLAAGTLLAMLLVGTFRTGETARAALFIWPYLLLPVAVHLHGRPLSPAGQFQLAALVFAQALVMQTFGTWFW